MKRAVQKNVAGYYLLFGVTALAGFVVSPILLASLGAAGFGLFKAAQKLMDVASVADGRTGQALKWTIARNFATGDSGVLRQAITNAVKTAVAYSPLLILVVVVLVMLAPTLANGVSASTATDLRMLVAVLGANLVLMPLLTIPDAVLMGSNRAYVSSLIQLAALIATNLGFVFVVKCGGGIVALGFVVLGGALLGAMLVFIAARLSTPWFAWERSEPKELRRFAGFSGWLLAWAGVEKVLLSGEILLLMGLVGAQAAASYVFATFPVQLFLAISLLTVSAATPSVATQMSTNKREAGRLARTIREGVFTAAVAAACLLLLLNRSFVSLWVGDATYIGDVANLLIALAMMQAAWIRCDAQLGDLTLDVAGRARLGLVATGLSILLPFGFVLFAGPKIEWVLFGVVLGRLLLNISVARQVKRDFELERVLRPSWIMAFVLVAGSFWIGSRYVATSWFEFAAAVLIAMVVIVPLSTMALMSPGVRKTLAAGLRVHDEAAS